MPSQLHDVLVELFRNRPLLAPELLRDALNVDLPEFSEARIESADLTNVQPAEYRADLVVRLLDDEPVPEVTDEAQAQSDPELAVLSAMAHGNDQDTQKAAQIALAARSAILDLDPDRSKLYFDLVDKHLSEAARRALQAMDLRKYEYQSDFARRYVAEGKAIGEANGRAALVTKLLVRRFGSLTQQAESRIASASIAELDEIAERLFTAQSLQEALG